MPILHITSPVAPPEWALLQRELMRAQAAACEVFLSAVLRRPRVSQVRAALGREWTGLMTPLKI